MERIIKALDSCISGMTLQKIILSKPNDPDVRRLCARLVKIKGKTVLQTEKLLQSGGAMHENIPIEESVNRIALLFEESYGQINIVDIGGNAEGRFSKNGKLMFYSKIKKAEGISTVSAQNRSKEYILSPENKYDFLVSLGRYS